MIKRIAALLCILSSGLLVNAGESSPASVVRRFCAMELQGTTLSGDSSEAAWALTSGEEEPFMGGEEIATRCDVLRTIMKSPSNAAVIVQFHVIGRLVEDADGTRHIVKVTELRRDRLVLIRSGGEWKISKKGLMHQPVRATPTAWAMHFHQLIATDPSKKTDVDRKLENLVNELKSM